MTKETVNGWVIQRLPEGFEFNWAATKSGYGELFYSKESALQYAKSHP